MSSEQQGLRTTTASREGKGAPQTLPVPRPLSPRSGAAQKVVSGLRLRTTFSMTGGRSVWGGGLCVLGEDLACVGGRGSVRTVDMTGRVTRTVRVCGSESWCGSIGRGDDGEVFVGRYGDRNISRVSADGAVSTFSSSTFSPDGLTQLSSGRLLVCGGYEGLYTVTGWGVQGVELGVNVECAVDVSVNSKGDVAVADRDGGKVYILDGQYKHVGTYSPKKLGPFRPESLTSDGENFVICDADSRTIHTIDRRGVCLSVYHTTDDCQEKPYRVDMLPSNCVWVLFAGGQVCVYNQISSDSAMDRYINSTVAEMSSEQQAPRTTTASRDGKGASKTLPVPRPLSPRSGAAQKVLSGLRLRTTFSMAGDRYVWGGGLCVTGEDLACVGGRGSVRTVDMTGRVTRTVRVCGGKSWCGSIGRADDGELFVGRFGDRMISLVSADGAVSTFSLSTFSPNGLTQLSSGRLLVCGGYKGLYIVTGRGVQGVELGVNVKCAVDVSVNSKGDVAVADRDGGKVCILDGQYKPVGTYLPTKSGPFRPENLTSDGENFVICDSDNRTIHTIDRQGVCLSVYRTTDDCREKPYRVDMLPSNCLWVLFGGGHVCVYDQI